MRGPRNHLEVGIADIPVQVHGQADGGNLILFPCQDQSRHIDHRQDPAVVAGEGGYEGLTVRDPLIGPEYPGDFFP